MARQILVVLGLVGAMAVPASIVADSQEKQPLKRTTIQQTSPSDAREMYLTYCAVCHGREGRGDGPAAVALKTAPTDLTTMTARHGGTYPENKVCRWIEGIDEIPAHGTRDMPVWGPPFRSLSGDRELVMLRVAALTDYLKSLQR